jgi:cation diffusion facilitator family transporter
MNAEAAKDSLGAARISLLAKCLLVGVQFVGGLKIGSLAMLSEAAHSGVDLLALAFAYLAIRAAAKPPDEGHPYGHGKAEHLSAAAEAVIILLTAGAIVAEAVRRLAVPSPIPDAGLGAALMAFSFAVCLTEAFLLKRAALKAHSPALEANSLHWLADMGSTGVVLFALAALWFCQRFMPTLNLSRLEPLAALAVAGVMGYTAYHLAVRSGEDLMDGSLPREETDWIVRYLGGLKKPVFGFHDLKTRRAGSQRFVEFHLLMDPDLSVERSHAVNDEIEAVIQGRLEYCTIQIHVEPAPR